MLNLECMHRHRDNTGHLVPKTYIFCAGKVETSDHWGQSLLENLKVEKEKFEDYLKQSIFKHPIYMQYIIK